MARVFSIVHGVLTAATVTATLGIHGLGFWLGAALGHRPRPCLDDIPHWTFQLTSCTTAWLMVVAYLGMFLWLPLTLVEALTPDLSSHQRHAFGLRVGLVLVAWASLCVDPTGGFHWFLD